jgi:hypothetical protein
MLYIPENRFTGYSTLETACNKMRDRPTMCESFRGCPNEALIYYSFFDKWLCGYCIGYGRISVPLCEHDGWRRGTCVDIESQSWFCELHGNRCDAIIERPPGLPTGNAHRCVQRAAQDHDGHWYCAEHMSELPDPRLPTPPPFSAMPPQLVFPLENTISLRSPPPSPRPYPASTNLGRRHLRDMRSMSNRPAPRPPTPPLNREDSSISGSSQSNLPRALVARITGVISSLSSVLISPENDMSTPSTSVVRPPYAPTVPVSRLKSLIDLDIFSTVVDTECCICLEPQRSMRRLVTCNHMFCEECLAKQVNGTLMRRHDCALCRKDMFPST